MQIEFSFLKFPPNGLRLHLSERVRWPEMLPSQGLKGSPHSLPTSSTVHLPTDVTATDLEAWGKPMSEVEICLWALRHALSFRAVNPFVIPHRTQKMEKWRRRRLNDLCKVTYCVSPLMESGENKQQQQSYAWSIWEHHTAGLGLRRKWLHLIWQGMGKHWKQESTPYEN